MTSESPSAADVASFLRDHPDFFQNFPDVLAGVTIPAAHGGRAISLHERQLEVLRDRHRGLENKLAELMRIGQENDAINEKMQHWTRQLLLESDAARLPTLVIDAMSHAFSVPQVALRLWRMGEAGRALPFAQPVDAEVIALADGMRQPYCGVNADFKAATWLSGEGVDTRSLALIALRKGYDPKSFGLLVLGSADADRFRSGMGTTFLERIGETASAALSRLVE